MGTHDKVEVAIECDLAGTRYGGPAGFAFAVSRMHGYPLPLAIFRVTLVCRVRKGKSWERVMHHLDGSWKASSTAEILAFPEVQEVLSRKP